jgi:hypothetical protein
MLFLLLRFLSLSSGSGRLAGTLFDFACGILPARFDLFCYSAIEPVSASAHLYILSGVYSPFY